GEGRLRVDILSKLQLGIPHLNPLPFSEGPRRIISGYAPAQPVRADGKSLASQHSQFRCFMIRMKRFLILQVFGALIAAMAHGTTNFESAAKATDELAVELHRQLATGNENLCVSPYSIESALA